MASIGVLISRKSVTVVNALGLMLGMFSFAFLLPIMVAMMESDIPLLFDFSVAAAITFCSGFCMWLFTRKYKEELSIRHGYLLAVSMWTTVPAFGAIPLLMAIPGLSFTDAYFEMMSGLTTSGGTVLTGLDKLPMALNIWRHEIVWLGGIGIIVLAVAILPLLGVGGRQLFKAETPGPMKDSALAPRIADTARYLWLAYIAITLVCVLCLKLAGMNWFDAVCHAFATMGLGGFSTHDASISYFNSPAIEFTMVFFMLIASINFATHFVAWHGRSLKAYMQDVEAKATLFMMLISCILIAVFLWWKGIYPDMLTALRFATFNTISVASSAGFASTDYNLWPILAPLWMMFIGCIACSSGSTGGGIKTIRTLILFKQSTREFLLLLHPTAIKPLRVGQAIIPNNVAFSVLGFIFLYFISVVSLTFLLLLTDLDFITAFTAILASINNLGPGLGMVGPASNFQGLTDFQTWVCTFAMLIGRLEIFTVFILFTPYFWRR